MVITRPSWLPKICYNIYPLSEADLTNPGFIVHPSTSELAERLQVDPEFLSNEQYSGIYDDSGDYIPQYCDDPEKVPQGGLQANPESPDPSGTAGGARAQTDDNPAPTADSGDNNET